MNAEDMATSSTCFYYSPFPLTVLLGNILLCSCTERTVEDHELALDIYHSWARDSGNRFVFREDPLKYDLFEHPIVYFFLQCT